MKNTKAFTLIEMMVVIFLVGILAAATVPIMRARTDAAKWTEGKAAVGAIRSAVRARFAATGSTEGLTGVLSDSGLQASLGFLDADLAGTYFVPGDYRILAVNSDGYATVQVAGSQPQAPRGHWTLGADGNWSFSSLGGDGGE